MFTTIYTSTIWITIGIAFVFCLFFCVLSIPKTIHLRNYRIARYVMACAYLTLGAMNVVELTVQPDVADMQSTKIIALLICLFQSFLFTYTNITLIHIDFATRRKIALELTPIIILCVAAPLARIAGLSPIYVDLLFYVFIAYYISVLVRYTTLFRRNYGNYIRKMDDFFAGQESTRFRWISLSFYAALTTGIMALFTTLFFSRPAGILFSFFIIGFYSYYGIQFINYAFLFRQIEAAMVEKEETGNGGDFAANRNHSLLETNIQKWIGDKGFLEEGLTIKNVALQLNTNRTYLSEYVNTCLQKTFKEWIGELRIEEAKTLLLKYPGLPIAEISDRVGFRDKSNFGRLFVKHTGASPKAWRVSNRHLEPQISRLYNDDGKN